MGYKRRTKAWFEGNPTWKKMPSETAKNGDTLYVWKKGAKGSELIATVRHSGLIQ